MAAAGITAKYLGWKPTGGTRGDQFVDPVVRYLLDRALRSTFKPKQHRLEVGGGVISIGELVCDDVRCSSGLQYPDIPLLDVSWVKVDPADSLTFGLILLGYNEESTCSVHVHAWRGDSAHEVAWFVKRLELAIGQPPQLDKHCLHQHQQLSPAAAPAASEADLGSLAHSLALELRQRLDGRDAAPLLHPPRDYDTLRRSHGNVRLRCSEEQLATSSQAPNGAYIRRQFVISASEADDSGVSEELDEPPADYDNDAAGNGGGGGGGGSAHNGSTSGASSSSQSLGEDSRWSDPRLGFSTWRH